MNQVMKTRAEHAQLINAAWQRGVESIIDTGERVSDAKLDLEHGEFLAMVESDLSFGPRTAQMLMAVASNAVISNPNHGSLLPPSWRTLYALSRLPQTLLLTKIKEGAIHPGLERKDVKALSPPPEPEQRDDDLPPDEESGAPAPDGATEPDDSEPNPITVAWADASTFEKQIFVREHWTEIAQISKLTGCPNAKSVTKPNGNTGAAHWAHLSKENAEAVDRWIESDK
jgi:Protein of unknown function (DUF3102)